MFGLASASTAAALSDQLYWGPFRKWLLLATFVLSYGLARYFRQQGVCTLDDAKRERKKVINVSLFTFGMFIVVYTMNYIIWRSHWHCFWNRCLEGKFDMASKPII